MWRAWLGQMDTNGCSPVMDVALPMHDINLPSPCVSCAEHGFPMASLVGAVVERSAPAPPQAPTAAGTFNTLSKKERLAVDRTRAKLEKNLGSISDMNRLPGALFVVDITREHIAVKEAQKLNIPIFAMVDTNSDPRPIDYVIPANDDASKSIEKIVSSVSNAIVEGLKDRKAEKDSDGSDEGAEVKTARKRTTTATPVASSEEE